MEEGLLGLHNVGVWHPEELHEAGVQSEALVAFKHQPLVRPALSEVYGGRVVLRGGRAWRWVSERGGGREPSGSRTRGSRVRPPPPLGASAQTWAEEVVRHLQ